MASDESMTLFSSLHDEDYDDTTDDGSDLHRFPHNISRLSMCSSSVYTNDGAEDDPMRLSMSRLSIEGFDADDEEFSDNGKDDLLYSGGDDDDEEKPGYYSLSLPSTPRRRRRDRANRLIVSSPAKEKDYASENDAAGEKGVKIMKSSRKRMSNREKNCAMATSAGGCFCCSGESESGGGGKGLMVMITRPKGGRRSLCMDMEEVKACRDLGFELEMASCSSAADSPIANWRISSPGDDPRDVKARLKVWAQAVALASASRQCV